MSYTEDPWVCKHGPIEYHDDGDPYCPDCDSEGAASDPLTLLDEFDRYASTPGPGEYNGSPFQERVRAVLLEAGVIDENEVSQPCALRPESPRSTAR